MCLPLPIHINQYLQYYVTPRHTLSQSKREDSVIYICKANGVCSFLSSSLSFFVGYQNH